MQFLLHVIMWSLIFHLAQTTALFAPLTGKSRKMAAAKVASGRDLGAVAAQQCDDFVAEGARRLVPLVLNDSVLNLFRKSRQHWSQSAPVFPVLATGDNSSLIVYKDLVEKVLAKGCQVDCSNCDDHSQRTLLALPDIHNCTLLLMHQPEDGSAAPFAQAYHSAAVIVYVTSAGVPNTQLRDKFLLFAGNMKDLGEDTAGKAMFGKPSTLNSAERTPELIVVCADFTLDEPGEVNGMIQNLFLPQQLTKDAEEDVLWEDEDNENEEEALANDALVRLQSLFPRIHGIGLRPEGWTARVSGLQDLVGF